MNDQTLALMNTMEQVFDAMRLDPPERDRYFDSLATRLGKYIDWFQPIDDSLTENLRGRGFFTHAGVMEPTAHRWLVSWSWRLMDLNCSVPLQCDLSLWKPARVRDTVAEEVRYLSGEPWAPVRERRPCATTIPTLDHSVVRATGILHRSRVKACILACLLARDGGDAKDVYQRLDPLFIAIFGTTPPTPDCCRTAMSELIREGLVVSQQTKPVTYFLTDAGRKRKVNR